MRLNLRYAVAHVHLAASCRSSESVLGPTRVFPVFKDVLFVPERKGRENSVPARFARLSIASGEDFPANL